MIIKRKKRLSERLGETRTVKRFLWFPLRAGQEYWWLEWVVLSQGVVASPGVGFNTKVYWWKNLTVQSRSKYFDYR